MKKKLNEESSSISVTDLGVHAHIKSLEAQLDLITKQNAGYQQTVDQLLSKLEQKDNTIRHLEGLLKSTAPVIIGEASPFMVSDEEYILEMVIKELKEAAAIRSLSKDEMTKLDLAIKNKRLIQGQATNIDAKSKPVKQLAEKDLLTIASRPLKE